MRNCAAYALASRRFDPPAASSTILIDFAADMDAAEALAFARKNPHAVLATMKRDGTLLSPVLVGVDLKDRLVSVSANPQ